MLKVVFSAESLITSGHLPFICPETHIFMVIYIVSYRIEFLSYKVAIGLIRKDFSLKFPEKTKFSTKNEFVGILKLSSQL